MTVCCHNYECDNSLCLDGKCRDVTSESGLCYNDKDDDCDGYTDFADSDCCGVEGAYCSGDSQCCGSMPCDDPVENAGTKCGCPDGFYWHTGDEECYLSGESCAPPSNCDTNPYQTACIRYSPIPFAPTEGCCEYGSYGGTTYYDWDDAHITTY